MRLGRSVRIAALALTLAAGPAAGDEAQEAADSSHAELDRFQTWIGEQIDRLEQEIGELRQELEQSEPAARERINEMIRQAQEAEDELRAEARELGDASAEQWEAAKARALSSWHRVQAAYYAALAELRGDDEDR
jgi:TolA-binding protein